MRCIEENAFLLVDPRNEQKEIGIYNRCNLRKYYSEDKVQEKTHMYLDSL